MIWRRFRYYPIYFVVFGVIYGAVIWIWGTIPGWLTLVVFGTSFGKDVLDEIRMQAGGTPIAYSSIEHNPSNIVLLVLTGLGFVTFGAPLGGIERRSLAFVIGGSDILLDGWQDLRAG